jgi:hypothetical protein
MSATHSAAIAQSHLRLQNRTRHLSIPQYHILILAWSALVILYGETASSLFFHHPAEKTASTRWHVLTDKA